MGRVAEGLSVNVDDVHVPDSSNGHAGRSLRHAAGVDGNVTVQIGEHLEDRPW